MGWHPSQLRPRSAYRQAVRGESKRRTRGIRHEASATVMAWSWHIRFGPVADYQLGRMRRRCCPLDVVRTSKAVDNASRDRIGAARASCSPRLRGGLGSFRRYRSRDERAAGSTGSQASGKPTGR